MVSKQLPLFGSYFWIQHLYLWTQGCAFVFRFRDQKLLALLWVWVVFRILSTLFECSIKMSFISLCKWRLIKCHQSHFCHRLVPHGSDTEGHLCETAQLRLNISIWSPGNRNEPDVVVTSWFSMLTMSSGLFSLSSLACFCHVSAVLYLIKKRHLITESFQRLDIIVFRSFPKVLVQEKRI